MVPYSTILVLLSLLMMLPGCTQKAPPVTQSTGAGQAASSPAPLNRRTVNPDPLVKPTNAPPVSTDNAVKSTLILDSSQNNVWKIKLGGEDAAKIYHLMEVAPSSGSASEISVKQGAQYVCTKTDSRSETKAKPEFECSVEAQKDDGEIIEILQPAQVKTSISEMAQTPEITTYLKIVDAAKGKKIRIFIAGFVAKEIYDALDLPNTRRIELNADQTNARGFRRAGQHVNCFAIPLLTAPEVPLYSCYVHLDFAKGTVDKIDTVNLQY